MMTVAVFIIIFVVSPILSQRKGILNIRLTNNATLEGSLEVLYRHSYKNGQEWSQEWLAVCAEGDGDDIEWNNQAAWVVCRQLGYYGGMATYNEGFSINNERRVNYVDCDDGHYNLLEECLYEVQRASCRDNEQAGVKCFDTNFSLKLTGERIPTKGRVEVFANNEWHAVCFESRHSNDEEWDFEAAIVVCRHLGFASGSPVAYQGLSRKGLQVNDVRCEQGLSSHLQECSFELQSNQCKGNMQAGVICYATNDENSQTRRSGTVIGSVVGVVLIAVILVLIYFLCRKKKREQGTGNTAMTQPKPEDNHPHLKNQQEDIQSTTAEHEYTYVETNNHSQQVDDEYAYAYADANQLTQPTGHKPVENTHPYASGQEERSDSANELSKECLMANKIYITSNEERPEEGWSDNLIYGDKKN